MGWQGWGWFVAHWPWITGAFVALGGIWVWGGRLMTLGRWFCNRAHEKQHTKVLNHLRDRGVLGDFIEDIATATGMTVSKLEPRLEQLEKENRVWRHHTGRWMFGSKTPSGSPGPTTGAWGN
jgi:hypothetical protein